MAAFLSSAKERLSQIYFLFVFTFLTLYLHNGYFDTIRTKGALVLWSSLFYDVAILCMIILELGFCKLRFGELFRDWNRMDTCLIAFACVCVISMALSPTRSVAFWGSNGCKVGGLTLTVLCIACILMSRYLRMNKWLIYAMLLSGVIVYAGCITDCFDLDLMGWHENIAASHYDYLSTIGNRDYFDGYLALLVPFFAVLFVFEKNKWNRILFAVYLLLGFVGMYIAKNDGNLLIFGAGIFLLYYMLKENADRINAVWLLLLLVAASLVIEVICHFVDPMYVTALSVMGRLMNRKWYIGLAILALLIRLSRRKTPQKDIPQTKKKTSKKDIRRTKKKTPPKDIPWTKLWIGFSVTVILILFCVVATHFTLDFGSHRGYIWSYGMETFRNSPFLIKLFGWGPDCYQNAIYSSLKEQIFLTWPEPNYIANAHNEPIQYLVTTGICGAIAYLCLYLESLRKKLGDKDVIGMAAKTAVFAYFCQALGTNPNGLNYGILFILFALIHRRKA